MQHTKIVHFLSLLSPGEIERFHTFLQLKEPKRHKKLRLLLSGLVNGFVKKTGEGPKNRIKLYQFIYGDRSFKEGSLKTLLAVLLKHTLGFLAWCEIEQDQTVQDLFLLKRLNRQKEQKYFQQYYARSKKKLHQTQMMKIVFFQHALMLEDEYLTYTIRQPKRDFQDNIKDLTNHSGHIFLLRMLRYAMRRIMLQFSLQQQSLSGFMELALQYINTTIEALPKVIQVYYRLYLALSHPNEHSYFTAAKHQLTSSVHEFSKPEALELHVGVLNLAVRQVNQGNLSFLTASFDLQASMLNHSLIIEQGKFSVWHFKNMVVTGLRLSKFEWVNALINEWGNRLDKDYAENALNYGRGLLAYYQGEYSEAERFLHLILKDYKDFSYGLNVRGYLLQVYYENGNTLGLESLSHSFRMYLDRNKQISGLKRKQYISFINHLKQLINIPLTDTNKFLLLKEKLTASGAKGMGTQWLLDKVEAKIQEA